VFDIIIVSLCTKIRFIMNCNPIDITTFVYFVTEKFVSARPWIAIGFRFPCAIYSQQHIRLYTMAFVSPYFKGINANIELQVYSLTGC
jgi:hypothetical protein